MSEIAFHKYHGTGNDFIMIDDRNGVFDLSDSCLIASMCARRFGIGADGLILLRDHSTYDFEMVYFNSDGGQSSMCGNGGRCIIQFAHDLGMIDSQCRFLAIDGPHRGTVLSSGQISLKMSDVDQITQVEEDAWQVDTGSPHYVKLMDSVENVDVYEMGRAVRYSDAYAVDGINVNFVERCEPGISVLTYERGVEDETYSCGTGATAAALISNHTDIQNLSPVEIRVKGGELKVHFERVGAGYKDIWLEGPTCSMYEGVWKSQHSRDHLKSNQ